MSKTERAEREYASARERAETHQSFERTAIKVPDGMTFFAPKKPGVYRLNVMPYIVGEGNPHAKPGQVHFERTYFAYGQIGPNKNTYIAPARTFGKRDPIQEFVNELQQRPDYDKELVKQLRPKERQLFVIQDLGDLEKGFQLWDVSFHLFGKFLDDKIKNCDPEDRDRYDMFFHPRKGLVLRVTAKEKSFGGRDFLEFNDIEFKDRSEQFSSKVVDEIPCLDDLLIELPYKELKDIFLQKPEEDSDDDDDPPPKAGKSKAKPADDDDAPVEVGQWIKFTYKEKTLVGKVTKIDAKKKLLFAKADDRPEPHTLGWADSFKITKAPAKN